MNRTISPRRPARRIGAPLVMALVLIGCSGSNEPNSAARRSEGAERATVSVTSRAEAPTIPSATESTSAGSTPDENAQPDGGTKGGDGSPITLAALSSGDLQDAQLFGELRCVFAATAGQLLVAGGNVGLADPAVGVVKVGGYVEPVSAPGGYDGMLKGATFVGQGKTIRVAPTGPAVGGGESPARPATLTFERADGASRTFPGRWTCGP